MNPFEQTFRAKSVEAPKPVDNIKATEHTDHDKRRMAATQQTILANKSKHQPYNSVKQKFSKRITITADANTMAAVCDITGAVVAVTFPRIPHKVFSYVSPLSIVSNCRGIAQEGKDYMRKLDTQTLAAIFITLAEDYDLLRSQPNDSGAQKNAILRTVAKDIIIDGILMIEDFVHSTNASFIPKLSIILSDDVMQSGIQNRFQQWLVICMEAIRKPDLRSYEEATSTRKPRVHYTVSAHKKQTVAFNKEFREWKRDAKTLIHSMKTKQQISVKLHDYLVAVVSNDNLANADVAMVDLLCSKLHSLNLHDATTLAHKINRYKIQLDDMNDASDAFSDTGTKFAAQPVGSTVVESTDEQPSELAQEAPNAMSFIERLKAKKAAAAKATSIQPAKQENDDALF